MIFGVLMALTGMIFSCLASSTAICILEYMFLYGGLSLLISGMVAKTYRIYRIFSNRKAIALVIKDWKLIVFMLLVMGYFLLLIGLSIIAGFGSYTFQSPSNPYYFFTSCNFASGTWRLIFRILLALSLLALIIVAVVLGVLNRNVPSSFGNARAIYISSVVVIIVYIIFESLYHITGSSTDSETIKFVIRLEMSVINTLTVLFVFFLPTIYRAYRYEKRLAARHQ